MEITISFLTGIALICIFVFLTTLISKLYVWYRQWTQVLPVWDISKGHHWAVFSEHVDTGERYCNVCEENLLHGMECDFCGLLVHDACHKEANNRLHCKELSSDAPSMKHHWVACNSSHSEIFCMVCEELCGDGPGLRDLSCSWCSATVHSHCKANYTQRCDVGKFKHMLVPPTFVKLQKFGWKGHWRYAVKEILQSHEIKNWNPLVVISNRLSGSGEGDLVLRTFRRLLNPIQVIDTSDIPPKLGLKLCQMLERCTVLIAGGDGTIGWVMESAETLQLTDVVTFAILPLGTGNDLSRALGFGSGHVGPVNGRKILSTLMAHTHAISLDRWMIRIENAAIRLSRGPFADKIHQCGKEVQKRLKNQNKRAKGYFCKMNNYFSVGVDALTTFNFHEKRSKLPRILSGRLMNKFLFLSYGTKDVLERACSNFTQLVQVFLDDRLVSLPELEGVVVLNIPFWGAGVKPWALGANNNSAETTTSQNLSSATRRQSMSDGYLEVFGLYSSFHIAQMQVGLSEPYRIGQAKNVRIVIAEQLPMQCDGEPWLNPPCEIIISYFGQVKILAMDEAQTQSLRRNSASIASFFL